MEDGGSCTVKSSLIITTDGNRNDDDDDGGGGGDGDNNSGDLERKQKKNQRRKHTNFQILVNDSSYTTSHGVFHADDLIITINFIRNENQLRAKHCWL